MGKSPVNGPFSIAMLNYQMVTPPGNSNDHGSALRKAFFQPRTGGRWQGWGCGGTRRPGSVSFFHQRASTGFMVVLNPFSILTWHDALYIYIYIFRRVAQFGARLAYFYPAGPRYFQKMR